MSDLLTAFLGIGRPRILVVGDLMLDRYTLGDAERISPEAPVIVLKVDREEIRPGGAASVAFLLKHLLADVSLAGVVGDDPDGYTLRALLRDEGIDERVILTENGRPTTTKRRFVGRASDRHPHQILRVDHECRTPVSESLASELGQAIRACQKEFDAVLIADYLKGACTHALLQQLIHDAKKHGQPILVDPGRITDYWCYRGATLIKPNRVEAELVCGQTFSSPEQALHAAGDIRSRLGLEAVLITLDRDGMVLYGTREQEVISAVPRTVYDITGAGDMAFATLGMCVASGVNLMDSARIANVAAGIEVEQFGVSPVTRSEIEGHLTPAFSQSTRKIVSVDEMIKLNEEYRRQGKLIVFTNGCFDLFHAGHLKSLEQAREMGDVLIVGVNSDASVQRLKGDHRPIVAAIDRARILAGLACVSHVVTFDEDTPCRLLEQFRPDVLVKGGTYSVNEVVGGNIVTHYGGRVALVPADENISTTTLIRRIQERTHVATNGYGM